MASIRERVDKDGVKTFHVQIRIRGFPPQTKTFTKKTIAKQWADEVELKIRSGRYLPTAMAQKRLARDLIQRYRTSILPHKKTKQRKDSARHLDWWDMRVGKYGVLELTSDLIGRCRDELLVTPTRTGKPPAPASVVKRMSVFSHVLTIAVKEWQWLPESPMSRVTKPKVKNDRVRYLSEDEQKRLLEATAVSKSPELHIIVVLAVATGMRFGEIMDLRWSDVVFQQNEDLAFVILKETKNGTQRGVPISAFALEYVKAWRKRAMKTDKLPNPELLLFPSLKNVNQPISNRTAWKTALRRSEIKDFRFHDLRHTAASYLAMSGATLLEISEILGHKDPKMSKRYSHLSNHHLAGVLTRMGDIHLPAAKEIKPTE